MVNYIPDPRRKRILSFKDKVVSLFKTKTSKQAVYGGRIKQKTIWRNNFWNNNYIEYESNGFSNKDLTLEEYLDKLKPYLRDIMKNYDINDKLFVSLHSRYQGNWETSMERPKILHAFKTGIP